MGTVQQQQYDSTVVLQTILPVKFESKISKRVASKRTTVLPGTSTHNLLASLHPYQPGQYNLKLVKDGVSSGTTWY
jgi:hypothetical protein